MVAELSAPSSALVTNLLVEGLRGRYELAAGGEARLRSELVMEDGELRSDGTITFAPGHELRFRTVGTAPPYDMPGPASQAGERHQRGHRRHGPVRRRCGGQIVSNIRESDTGEVTDNHLGVIFVEATP